MSVNGTEINKGQVWRCADGFLRAVLAKSVHLRNFWVLSGGFMVDENGCAVRSREMNGTQVLVSIEHQGTHFRHYGGLENPAPGFVVAVELRSGVVAIGPSEILNWSRPKKSGDDIISYSVGHGAGEAPWYPDDSGKWVEVPPGVDKRPDGLHPKTLVATLSSGERNERQHLWPTPLKASRWNWSVIVAYKVVELDTEKSAENREPAKTPGVTAPQLLEKAASHMRDRAATYDRPEGERSMAKTVAAFNAITGRDLTETEGWLLLQVLKDVRLFQRPGYHADSAEDGIAYSALKAESKSKEV